MAGWHDHPLAWKTIAAARRYSPRMTPAQVLEAFKLENSHLRNANNTVGQIQTEMLWTQNDRPYYDLYPGVAEALIKIDLDKLDCDEFRLPLPELMIRMPVGRELQLSSKTSLRTLLVGEVELKNRRGWVLSLNTGATMKMNGVDVYIHTVQGLRLTHGSTLMDHYRQGRDKPYSDDTLDNEAILNTIRLVATLCLLKDDPDLIEPLPLEVDRAKWELTHDLALIEKASRRGKVGFAIGKHVEVAPGFRRPHFGIRWCGKGRTDPRVRPIKGCLVRKRVITEVPTDWLGPLEP